MSYKFDEPIYKITSPIVLRFEGKEQEFDDPQEAHKAEFDKRVIVDTIEAENGKIVFNPVENTHYLDASWSDKPVNVFDGD